MAQIHGIARICLVLAIVAVQCSTRDRNSPTADKTAVPLIVSTHPSNGSSDIPPGANVGIVFNMPMDTESVDHAFHLAGGPDLLRWLDSLSHHGTAIGHPTNMNAMMQWLDSLQPRGSFLWKSNLDTVVFVPDTRMMDNQPHMIFLHGSVKGRNGRSMVLDTFPYGGFMIQFSTGAGLSP